MIEILTSTALNTVQDFGRPQAMSLGVSWGGAMDHSALAWGNILLGNPADAAGIEVAFFPFRIRFLEERSFSITGAQCNASLDNLSLPANWAITAKAGQILTCGALEKGCRVYICVEGGLDVPIVFGARATDLKAALGGYHGRGLQRNDHIPCGPRTLSLPTGGYGLTCPPPLPERGSVIVHALAAAEYHDFTPESRARFFSQPWRITSQANRAGYRLEGDPLRRASDRELFSHGIMPGTVQIPPSGQPIIQLADANTMGGYPKIATVIESDLRLLAQAPIGASVFFHEIDIDAAVQRQRDTVRKFQDNTTKLSELRGSLIPWNQKK